MSYPSPPGPPDPRLQGPANPTPGWQSQPYQPQGGNWAAPQYGGPPRKDRAGLIIVVIVVLLAVILGIGGFLAYRLTAGDSGAAPAPRPTPSAPAASSPTSKPTQPQRSVPTTVPSQLPSKPVTTAPTQSVPTKPAGKGTKAEAVALAGRFVAQLNAGNSDAAVALTCKETRQLVPTLISVWIKPPTKLTVTDAAIGQEPYLVPVTGTTNGKKVHGMVIVQESCVRVFNLSPS